MSEQNEQAVFINNRYRVDKKLGEGGMGAVYRVSDTQQDDRVLALKIMKRLGGENEDSYHKLFKREFEQGTRRDDMDIGPFFEKIAECLEHLWRSLDFI